MESRTNEEKDRKSKKDDKTAVSKNILHKGR